MAGETAVLGGVLEGSVLCAQQPRHRCDHAVGDNESLFVLVDVGVERPASSAVARGAA